MFEDISCRRRVLDQLQLAIRSRLFDDQTVSELLQLLDHEYLCIQYERPQSLLRNGYGRRSRVESWTEELLEQISQCIIQPIHRPSPLEKELLFRALLSTLNLLHAQGATQVPEEYRSQLYSRFEDELKVLLPQEFNSPPPPFTADYFRTVQCSYLLRLSIDCVQLLKSPLPEPVTVLLERWIVRTFDTQHIVSNFLPKKCCGILLTE